MIGRAPRAAHDPAYDLTKAAGGTMPKRLLWILTAVLMVTPSLVKGEDYLPLALGNFWVYDGSYIGEHEETRVADIVQIWGSDVYAILYENSTHNNGLINYWTTTPDGDVDLWGFRGWDGYGLAYRPALRVVDGPLFLGKRWGMEIDVYQTPDTTYGWHEVWAFEVTFEGDLDLPVGRLHVFGVEPVEPDSPRNQLFSNRSPEGHLSVPPTSRSRTPDVWWSDTVGRVQYSSSDLYELSAYGQMPVPVETSSWGRIKALYSK
jgi:hypothetical protein